MTNPAIKLEFQLDEVNVILSALGNLPYAQVIQLVNKIQAQATPQLAPKPIEPTDE
jgi:hypothetical protein